MFVQNMCSPRSGREVANQFQIRDNGKVWFQSYGTLIAVVEDSQVTLDINSWDYSKTTGKYRNQFLGETKRETERKIKSGEYRMADLNS